MYIVIVGGGRLGYYLAKTLLDEGHEVVIVEKEANICEAINDELGSICLRGDGCEVSTLAEVGTERADMLIAVTGEDPDNLVACQVAKHRFNVPRTIARIRNPHNEPLFKKLGVDITISSTNLILEYIEEKVPTHPLIHLLNIEESGLEIVEIKIPPESTTMGKFISELLIPEESKLILIIRTGGKSQLPTGDITLRAGDRIIALTSPKMEGKLRTILTGI
jgi:trk system potassium uptake protein TrkA